MRIYYGGASTGQHPYKTSYAAIYIYNGEVDSNGKGVDQTVPIEWYCDDGGKLWLNGSNSYIDDSDPTNLVQVQMIDTQQDPGTDINNFILTIKPGINFLLVKTTNSDEGGMKFKIVFHPDADKKLYFANSL